MNQRSSPITPQRSAAAASRPVPARPVLGHARLWRGDTGDAKYFVDVTGRQHFNFLQQIWLDVSVPMAYTRVHTTALETLAVNLLSMATPERDQRAAIGLASRRAVLLACVFCEECLLDAPEDAWVLPRQTIRAWLASHRGVDLVETTRLRGTSQRELAPICARAPKEKGLRLIRRRP